jgi:hypothetical protein
MPCLRRHTLLQGLPFPGEHIARCGRKRFGVCGQRILFCRWNWRRGYDVPHFDVRIWLQLGCCKDDEPHLRTWQRFRSGLFELRMFSPRASCVRHAFVLFFVVYFCISIATFYFAFRQLIFRSAPTLRLPIFGIAAPTSMCSLSPSLPPHSFSGICLVSAYSLCLTTL